MIALEMLYDCIDIGLLVIDQKQCNDSNDLSCGRWGLGAGPKSWSIDSAEGLQHAVLNFNNIHPHNIHMLLCK